MKTEHRSGPVPAGSLRERKKQRTRRTIQAQALRLFTEKGFRATTIEEIAAAAEVAPRTVFRYFPTKEEIVFWAEFPPMLAGFVSARPADEPAVQAVHHGIVDGLTSFSDQDRERLLARLKLAFRTSALQPRMRQQQAHWADELAEILAHRLGAHPDDLEIRATAAAIAAAVWVASEHWQAQDGQEALGTVIDRALNTVLGGLSHAMAIPAQRLSSPC
jgi:AcrR family transcriptional regulator